MAPSPPGRTSIRIDAAVLASVRAAPEGALGPRGVQELDGQPVGEGGLVAGHPDEHADRDPVMARREPRGRKHVPAHAEREELASHRLNGIREERLDLHATILAASATR